MKRVVLLVVVTIALLAVVSPAASAVGPHAATGKYAAIDVVDGSNLTVKIRANRIALSDDGGTVCNDAGLGFAPARHAGALVVVDSTSVSVTADVECRGAMGWVSVIDDLTITYTHDSASGILTDSTGQTYSAG